MIEEQTIDNKEASRENQLRKAGMLILAGLLVEILCLGPADPIAFVIFTGLGGLAIASGVFIYLNALIN